MQHPASSPRATRLTWVSRAAARFDPTTLRFLITGASAALLFFALSFGLVRAGLPPFGGTLAAYAITVAASYTAQHAWTFRGRARHAEALPRYLAAQIACGLLSGVTARLLVGVGGLPPLPMAAITTVLQSAVSYILSRYWVFARTGRR